MLPTQQTPPLVNYYAEQWPRYVKLCVDYANEITQFSVGELAVIRQEDGGGKAYWGVFPQQCENQLYDNLRKQAENIVDRLVSLATESFTPPGVTVEIKPKEFTDHFLPDKDSFLGFDPASVWNALAEQYGGGLASETAYQQSAAKIVSAFQIRKGQPLEIKAGAVILNLTVYIDHFDAKHFNRKNLCYRSREELCKLLAALEAFLAWAEIDLDLPGLQRLKHRFNGPCQVNSRENIRVVNGLNIVTFQYRFEFRFSGELADKIALFIGLYGSHAMGIAA